MAWSWGSGGTLGWSSTTRNGAVCLNEEDPDAYFGTDAVLEPEPQSFPPIPYSPGTCSTGNPKTFPPNAFLTLPSNCTEALSFGVAATSWQQPGAVGAGSGGTALKGCANLALTTERSAQPSVDRTTTSSGLDFKLNVNQDGMLVNFTPAGRLIPSRPRPLPNQEAPWSLSRSA